MDTTAQQLSFLLELDNRHDDLLRRLGELDKRVEQVLSGCLREREIWEGKGPSSSADPPAETGSSSLSVKVA